MVCYPAFTLFLCLRSICCSAPVRSLSARRVNHQVIKPNLSIMCTCDKSMPAAAASPSGHASSDQIRSHCTIQFAWEGFAGQKLVMVDVTWSSSKAKHNTTHARLHADQSAELSSNSGLDLSLSLRQKVISRADGTVSEDRSRASSKILLALEQCHTATPSLPFFPVIAAVAHLRSFVSSSHGSSHIQLRRLRSQPEGQQVGRRFAVMHRIHSAAGARGSVRSAR